MSGNELIIAMTSVIFGTGAAVAITWLIAQTVLKYRKLPEPSAGMLPGLDERLERIENAIDAMAVEMERVSEGQRFTTRLLTEQGAQKLKP